MSRAQFRLTSHTLLDEQVIEVLLDDQVVAAIYPENNGLRVIQRTSRGGGVHGWW